MPLLDRDNTISSFAGGLCERLASALEHAEFTQLVLVGSANDIARELVSLHMLCAVTQVKVAL
jgi:hypothetical protein